MCHLFEYGLGRPGQISTGANRHKAPSCQAKDETAMDRQARERLELSGLCALRRFTSEMLRGSPRNPTQIIKPSADLKVKHVKRLVLSQFEPKSWPSGRHLPTPRLRGRRYAENGTLRGFAFHFWGNTR
jgi:hypothetical protein